MEQLFSEFGMTFGVGGLILFMVFIIYDLAKRSNAGKFGTMILFIGLGLGIFGFLVKGVITYLMNANAQ